MANYFIIGGDGKEYGPVTEADVRQWIAEGRLNGISQAKAESDAEFRALAQFPEFAAALAAAAPATPLANPNTERLAALDAVRPPAISLMVVSVLGFLLSAWAVFRIIFYKDAVQQEMRRELEKLSALFPQFKDAQIDELVASVFGTVGIATNLFAAAVSLLIFFAALKFRKLQSFPLVLAAVILAMIPCATNCCAWVFGVPIGIWALVVLNKKGVKSQFK
jgi:predicted PurR-regulated permease PerM